MHLQFSFRLWGCSTAEMMQCVDLYEKWRQFIWSNQERPAGWIYQGGGGNVHRNVTLLQI